LLGIGELETQRGYILAIDTSRTSAEEAAGRMEGLQVLSLLPKVEADLGMKCGRFVVDGKNLPADFKAQHPGTEVHADGWHYRKKGIGKAFHAYVTLSTACNTTPAKAKAAGQFKMADADTYILDSKGSRIPCPDSRDVQSQKMRVRQELRAAEVGLQFQFQRVVEVSKGDMDTMVTLWRGYIFHLMGCHEFCTDERIGLSSIGVTRCQNDPPVFSWRRSILIMAGFLHGVVDTKSWTGLVDNLHTSNIESFFHVLNLYRDKDIHLEDWHLPHLMAKMDWNTQRSIGRRVLETYDITKRDFKTIHRHKKSQAERERKHHIFQYALLKSIFPRYVIPPSEAGGGLWGVNEWAPDFVAFPACTLHFPPASPSPISTLTTS
jgi:hypothetical protein